MVNDSEDLLGLFSAEVFHSIRVELSIMNSATRTAFRADPPSQLVEITDEGFVLEVPANACNTNQNLLIDAKAIPTSGNPIEIEVTARVTQVDHNHDGTDRVELSFVQIDGEQLRKFHSVFGSRQEEVTRFLAAARGYG